MFFAECTQGGQSGSGQRSARLVIEHVMEWVFDVEWYVIKCVMDCGVWWQELEWVWVCVWNGMCSWWSGGYVIMVEWVRGEYEVL